MFKFKLKSKQNKAPDKIKLLQNFNNIQTLDDLPVKNYNELNVYSNTNIGDNDTFPIWNSFISSMERITWLEYKNNLKIQILPNYSITINSTNYFFDEDNNIDITSEFTSYLKKNGSILLDGSYLPTDPNSIVPKKYVDSRTAYSFIYKTTQTIGDYLDILPTKDYVDNIVDGYATEVYVDTKLTDYINKNGATAFTGSANFGGYEVINMGAPTSTNSGATKGYVDDSISTLSSSVEVTYQKLTPTADVNFNNNKGINVATGTANTDAVNKGQMDEEDNLRLKLDGTSLPTADINLNNKKIINLAAPTANNDASTKLYTDTQDSLKISRDGTSTITANIPMNNFKFTGLSAGTANGQSLRYDEFATSPKVRTKIEPNYTGLSISVSTNAGSPTNITTGLADTAPLFVGGKIQPLNQPTILNIQVTLTGTFTVGAFQSGTILILSSLAGSSVKPLGKYYLGTANGALNVYSYFSYEVDVGGNVFTNGAILRASVDNGNATITGISLVISQYLI